MVSTAGAVLEVWWMVPSPCFSSMPSCRPSCHTSILAAQLTSIPCPKNDILRENVGQLWDSVVPKFETTPFWRFWPPSLSCQKIRWIHCSTLLEATKSEEACVASWRPFFIAVLLQSLWLLYVDLGVSINGGTPMDGLSWRIPLKWMIWGYPYFRKPPFLLSWLQISTALSIPTWVTTPWLTLALGSFCAPFLDLFAMHWFFGWFCSGTISHLGVENGSSPPTGHEVWGIWLSFYDDRTCYFGSKSDYINPCVWDGELPHSRRNPWIRWNYDDQARLPYFNEVLGLLGSRFCSTSVNFGTFSTICWRDIWSESKVWYLMIFHRFIDFEMIWDFGFSSNRQTSASQLAISGNFVTPRRGPNPKDPEQMKETLWAHLDTWT